MKGVTIKTVGDTASVAYAGKVLGNTGLKFSDDAADNLARFVWALPPKVVYNMIGVSKHDIADVDIITPDELLKIEVDVVITRNPDALLVMKAADCIPLVFYVSGEKILALAHVGVTGAALHLPAKVIKKLGYPPEQIKCFVGPCISKESYRFESGDISDKKLDSSWDKYVSREADGVHIDVLGYVLGEMKNTGMKAENIELDGIDTGSDPDYFSHRRHMITGEPDGRNTYAAWLK